ncbi:TPA: glycosyltransferase family 4 protein [Clostridium sporogenes]
MIILHITSHLGGGVGKVISNICSYEQKLKSEYKHKIILLEEPEKTQYINIAKLSGVEIIIKPSRKILEKELKDADIVQIEWWHHPIMCNFLYDFPKIPVRLIIWSHISGCSYPFVRKNFLMNCNRFLFTSPYSLENPYLKEKDVMKFINKKTDVVYSSGGFNNITMQKNIVDNTFNIGYVGTLNLCKLNPDFISYCNSVNIPNCKFIMVGDASIKENILNEARKKHIYEKFQFVGYTDDVKSQLNRMDVFGYPLNPQHYGTTENALLEAMAAGIPPVVLNQCAEKYIVKNMETGIIVNNAREYGEAIEYLYNNPNEKVRIGVNARKYVIDNLGIKNTIYNLNKNYDLTMKDDKKIISFKSVLGDTPAEWFLSCFGKKSKAFKESMDINSITKEQSKSIQQEILKILSNVKILKENNKSSLFHFARYFPEDKWLKYWKDLFEKAYY